MLLLSAVILPGKIVIAETVDESVFLQGKYLEVGISPQGWFGPPDNLSASVPSGFHPTSTDGLGFVADFQQDGWESGSPPYTGDYIVAGSPYEGFAVEWTVSGNENSVCQGNDICKPGFINTSLIETSIGDTLSATWMGETESHDGQRVHLIHNMHFTRNDLFILVDTTIENIGSVNLESVEFLRGVDPDNDKAWPGGDFETINQVIHQPGEGGNVNKALIRAAGTGSPDILLFLGTSDHRARVSLDRDWMMDTDQVVNSPSNGPRLSDEALALAWRLGTIEPGDSVVIHYFYSFGTDAQAEELINDLANPPCPGTEITLLGGSKTAGDWTVSVPPAAVSDGTCLELSLIDSEAGPSTGPGMKSLGSKVEARMINSEGNPLSQTAIPIQVCYQYDLEDLEKIYFNPVNLMIGYASLEDPQWEFPPTSAYPAVQQVCINTTIIGEYGLFTPTVMPSTGFVPGESTTLSSQPYMEGITKQDALWLVVPRLGIRTPIVGVPLTDDGWDVSWLGNQAGWLQGSAFPTFQGNSILTGHVWGAADKPGPFLLLNTLWFGDQVIVDAWEQEYVYEVRSIYQVPPDDLRYLSFDTEETWLTLITCRGFDPSSGTYQWRVLVRAVLVEIK